MRKMCGELECPEYYMCQSHDLQCYPCRSYCNQTSDNFDAHICERQCQDYIHDYIKHYVKAGEIQGSDSLQEKDILKFMMVCVVVLIVISLVLISIMTSLICNRKKFSWTIENEGEISNLKTKMAFSKVKIQFSVRTQAILDRAYWRVCPPLGNSKFEVQTLQTTSLMFGCAYMESLQAYATLFNLWLERPEKRSVHGNCDNMQNMDHFMFECLSKLVETLPTDQDEFEMGWQYISLLEHTAESMQNKTKTRIYRCALYAVDDQDYNMVRSIHMVISKPIIGEQFDVSQCNGLLDIMARDQTRPKISEGYRYWTRRLYAVDDQDYNMVRSIHMVISKPIIGEQFDVSQCNGLLDIMARDQTRPKIPEGYRYWPDGSLYIYLLGRKTTIFVTNPSTTTTTRRPSTTTTTSRPTTTTITSRPSTTTTTSHPSTTTSTSRPSTTTTTSHPSTTTTTRRPIITTITTTNDAYPSVVYYDHVLIQTQAILDRAYWRVCPPLGNSKFEVQTLQTTSLMFGCAYIESLQATYSYATLFHLWLERPDKRSVHGNCDNMQNMDHFMFECLSKIVETLPTDQDEFEIGWQYISLLEHTAESMQNKTKTRIYRCALYAVDDQDYNMVRSIHMVISKPIIGEQFDVSQCNGLLDIMERYQTRPKIPEGYRYWPDGSLYIYLIGRKTTTFVNNPSTTTTTKRPSTSTTTKRPTTIATTTTTEKHRHTSWLIFPNYYLPTCENDKCWVSLGSFKDLSGALIRCDGPGGGGLCGQCILCSLPGGPCYKVRILQKLRIKYRVEIEEMYFSAMSLGENLLQRVSTKMDDNGGLKSNGTVHHTTHIMNCSANSCCSCATVAMKLAPIDIPTFSGAYEEWSAFHDIYEAMVHNNPPIDDIQRFFSFALLSKSFLLDLKTMFHSEEHLTKTYDALSTEGIR
eukprot:XP_016662543.1 PREDICTED: uncharacterized protein LOC100573927 [Acyrthosiphon pisum]